MPWINCNNQMKINKFVGRRTISFFFFFFIFHSIRFARMLQKITNNLPPSVSARWPNDHISHVGSQLILYCIKITLPLILRTALCATCLRRRIIVCVCVAGNREWTLNGQRAWCVSSFSVYWTFIGWQNDGFIICMHRVWSEMIAIRNDFFCAGRTADVSVDRSGPVPVGGFSRACYAVRIVHCPQIIASCVVRTYEYWSAFRRRTMERRWPVRSCFIHFLR